MFGTSPNRFRMFGTARNCLKTVRPLVGARPRPRDPGHPRGLRWRRRHGARPPSPSSPSHHLITNSIISSSHLRAYLLCTILKGGYDLSLSAHLRCTRPQMHTTTAVSWRASTKTGTCWRTRPLLWPGGAPRGRSERVVLDGTDLAFRHGTVPRCAGLTQCGDPGTGDHLPH